MRYDDASRSDKQAIRAARRLDRTGEARHRAHKDDGYVRSSGNVRNHRDVFRVVSRWCQEQSDIKRFNAITPEQAERFLCEKAVDVSDKTLAGYAVALEHHLRHNGGHGVVKLQRAKSELPSLLKARAYTQEAVAFLRTVQSPRASLSTQLCYEAGLRAHELHTLQPLDSRAPSARRAWRDDRFGGREHWARYTVKGKGGLVREIRIHPDTAVELEGRRYDIPRSVMDREIQYRSHYDVMGGKSFSNMFSRLSLEQLGHSRGAHGLRHSYAQTRLDELMNLGKRYDDAKAIVSQELGHFRPSITDIYLR